MAKRKATNDGKGRSSNKKPKPGPLDEDEEDDCTYVLWAPPAAKLSQGSDEETSETVDEELAQPYAPTLYNLPWDQLAIEQTPLQQAPLKSPIGSTTKDLTASRDKNRSSQALREFYNKVKGWSLRKRYRSYHQSAFEGHFASGDQNTAIAVTKANEHEILVLAEDCRLQV